MINYVNVGIAEFLKTKFPDYVVAMGIPEKSRDVLVDAAIKAQKAKTLKSSNTAGMPGIVVWNTGTSTRESAQSVAQGTADGGFHMGIWRQTPQQPPHTQPVGWFNITKTRPVWAHYTVKAWAATQSDANNLAREFWFMDVYNNFDIQIQGRTFNIAVTRKNDIDMDWVVQDDTAKSLLYELTIKLEVPTMWVHSEDLPPIESIVTHFETLVNGAPIELEDITIYKDPNRTITTDFDT